MYKWFKKYFIPHDNNDYRPHFLRHESILIVFFIIIVIELGFLVQVFLVFDKTKFLASVLPGVLASLTNKEREVNNAPPLVQSDLLAKAAQLKAEDMASKGYFAHTSPEGITPWYWFNQVGYKYVSAGENLAVNFFESEDVAKAWMNSPTHRANIVKKDFTEIGIGVARGVFEGRNTIFVAQLFGTPFKIVEPIKTQVAPTPVTPQPSVPAVPKVPATQVTVQVLGEEVVSPALSPLVIEKNPKDSPVRLSIEKALASPRQSVAYAYGGITLLILLSLLLAFFIKFELQHPLHILRGLSLFAVVTLFLFFNIHVFSLETKVPANNTSYLEANVIQVLEN